MNELMGVRLALCILLLTGKHDLHYALVEETHQSVDHLRKQCWGFLRGKMGQCFIWTSALGQMEFLDLPMKVEVTVFLVYRRFMNHVP